MNSMAELLVQRTNEHIELATKLQMLSNEVNAAADLLLSALQNGAGILLCGNGGSATDADHLAGELVGRFLLERASFPAIALAGSTATLTAVANDYGYEEVFARQVRGLGRAGGCLIAISTSGNSPSITKAVAAAKEVSMTTIAMTGQTGGQLAPLCDVALRIPNGVTARIQEMHMLIGHTLCEYLEARLAAS